MGELESLQYAGFAFAYCEDCVEFASTSSATSCGTAQFIDYLRSVIVASKNKMYNYACILAH